MASPPDGLHPDELGPSPMDDLAEEYNEQVSEWPAFMFQEDASFLEQAPISVENRQVSYLDAINFGYAPPGGYTQGDGIGLGDSGEEEDVDSEYSEPEAIVGQAVSDQELHKLVETVTDVVSGPTTDQKTRVDARQGEASNAGAGAGGTYNRQGRRKSRSMVSLEERRKRHKMLPEHTSYLEMAFSKQPSPTAQERQQMAELLDVPLYSIHNWFQNRRAKEKKLRAAAGVGLVGDDKPKPTTPKPKPKPKAKAPQKSAVTPSIGRSSTAPEAPQTSGPGSTAATATDPHSNSPDARSHSHSQLRVKAKSTPGISTEAHAAVMFSADPGHITPDLPLRSPHPPVPDDASACAMPVLRVVIGGVWQRMGGKHANEILLWVLPRQRVIRWEVTRFDTNVSATSSMVMGVGRGTSPHSHSPYASSPTLSATASGTFVGGFGASGSMSTTMSSTASMNASTSTVGPGMNFAAGVGAQGGHGPVELYASDRWRCEFKFDDILSIEVAQGTGPMNSNCITELVHRLRASTLSDASHSATHTPGTSAHTSRPSSPPPVHLQLAGSRSASGISSGGVGIGSLRMGMGMGMSRTGSGTGASMAQVSPVHGLAAPDSAPLPRRKRRAESPSQGDPVLLESSSGPGVDKADSVDADGMSVMGMVDRLALGDVEMEQDGAGTGTATVVDRDMTGDIHEPQFLGASCNINTFFTLASPPSFSYQYIPPPYPPAAAASMLGATANAGTGTGTGLLDQFPWKPCEDFTGGVAAVGGHHMFEFDVDSSEALLSAITRADDRLALSVFWSPESRQMVQNQFPRPMVLRQSLKSLQFFPGAGTGMGIGVGPSGSPLLANAGAGMGLGTGVGAQSQGMGYGTGFGFGRAYSTVSSPTAKQITPVQLPVSCPSSPTMSGSKHRRLFHSGGVAVGGGTGAGAGAGALGSPLFPAPLMPANVTAPGMCGAGAGAGAGAAAVDQSMGVGIGGPAGAGAGATMNERERERMMHRSTRQYYRSRSSLIRLRKPKE